LSLWAAGPILLVAPWRNRIRKTFKRLKEPRYLIGAALVALYLFTYVGRVLRPPPRHGFPKIPFDVLPFLDAALFGLAVIVLAAAWLFGTRAPLNFTEAEVQLLFPAPLTRRSILHYKLATGLLRVGFGALVSAFFFSRTGLLPFWRIGPAAWLGFGTMWMHLVAVGMTRASLRQHGRSAWRGRLGTLAVLAGIVALGVVAAKRLVQVPPVHDLSAFPSYLSQLLSTRPLSWLVAPAHALVQIAAGHDWTSFGHGLGVALAVFAVHYVWVVRSDQAFEDAALAAAERKARAKESRRSGMRAPLSGARLRRPWLKLQGHGRPEWAIAWKNAVACQRLFVLPLVILIASLLFPLSALGFELLTKQGSDTLFVMAAIAAGAALLLAPLGPMMLRADLRQDVKQLDILRALPLRGWQVVLAEMAGPWILISVLQGALLISALVLSAAGRSTSFGWDWRLAVAASVLMVGPTLCAAMLLVQNAGVVLFPAWVAYEPGQRGLEAMGQRMLSLLGTLLVSAVGLLPGAALGGALYLGLRWVGLPVLGVPVAAAVVAIVLVLEIALGIKLAGRAFDTLDVSLD